MAVNRLFALPGCLWLVLAACTTAPVPDIQLAKAETRIQQANAVEAEQYAPVELRSARQHFNEAKSAINRGDNIEARRLLEKAEVDAELAAAMSNLAQSQQAASEVDKSLDLLRDELNNSY